MGAEGVCSWLPYPGFRCMPVLWLLSWSSTESGEEDGSPIVTKTT